MFRHKFIFGVMIFVVLSLLVNVSMIVVSNSSRRVFSGIVYANSGVPISGAYIWASGSEGYGSNTTDSLGQYTIGNLNPGNYTVTASATGYVEGEVKNVEVTAGHETSNVNFYLNLSGGISGTVTDHDSGLPLQNIWIRAENATSGAYVTGDYTDADGNYLIVEDLPTGTYNVTASDPEGHLEKTLGNITVTAGVETKGENLTLELSGIISGTVTDAVSHLPLPSIAIIVKNATGATLFGNQYGVTNSSGNYRINTNLINGTYSVTAWFPEGHVDKTVNVTVTTGVEVTADLALSPSGIISGRVTAIPSGKPLAGASILATNASYMGIATTNATGYYKVSSGLGNGTYTVMATYSGQYNTSLDVVVVEGLETPNVNINITVAPSGIITGKVTDTSSKPIEGALVTAEGGSAGSGEAYTDVNGTYIISSGLDAGSYNVTASAHGYSTQTNSSVSVTVGEVTIVDFQLSKLPPEQLGTISGTAQGAANPIPEIQQPIAILLIATAVAVMLIKLSNAKAKRKRPQESTPNLIHGA